MYKILSLNLLFIWMILSSSVSFAEEGPKITTTKINDNFWVFHGGNGLGANVGMSIGEDGIILIDSMNVGKGKLLIEEIRKISDKPIKYVINTHHHRDHRGGNEDLVALGATIIYPDYLKHTSYQGASRDIQFKDKMSFSANGEIFTLYHVKSHTWNDVIVHMKNNNAVFTGDNHATSWGPNIGVMGYQGHRIIFDLVLDLANEDTLVVPGHKALVDLNHIKAFDAKTTEWFQHVLALHKAGKSAEDILSDKKIVALFTWFHDGRFPNWLKPDRQLARVLGTINADTSGEYKMNTHQIKPYLGNYLLDDGSQVTIFSDDTGTFAQKDQIFMANLLIKSPSKFDFNGWDEKENLTFELNKQGQVKKLSFNVNGVEKFSAVKQ